MGGGGSSSGISRKGKKYGTEYRTLFRSGNIKFIEKINHNMDEPLETMTKGRVYVTVIDGKLNGIHYYDKSNKRVKTVHFNTHKKMKPHTHHGYFHNEEDSSKGASKVTVAEQRMIERVEKLWDNYKNNN